MEVIRITSWETVGIVCSYFGLISIQHKAAEIHQILFICYKNDKASTESIEKKWNTDSVQIKITFLEIGRVHMIFHIILQWLTNSCHMGAVWSNRENVLVNPSYIWWVTVAISFDSFQEVTINAIWWFINLCPLFRRKTVIVCYFGQNRALQLIPELNSITKHATRGCRR